jgi:D-amino-acid oxidase
MELTRRAWISSTAAMLAGCAARRTPIATTAARLPRVRVSADRVIRTIVGLRPYRPSGFVVRAEKVGEKLVVHNYGHGGAGITLSWGTAWLAVEEGAKSEARECAVIGCGVVGLSTARLLQERGLQPVIYAREMPPATTSNVAGGLWSPVTVYDHTKVTPEFRRQYVDAATYAFRRYQSMAGEWYGVRWLPWYSLTTEGPHRDPSPESPNYTIEPLYPGARQLSAAENPFNVPYAHRKHSMLIEPAIYLNALLRDFQIAGGRVVVREFGTAAGLAGVPEKVLYNCTGLGARALFGDLELTPVRGQLTFLLPQPEIEYMTTGPGDIYMFPRRDGILLGGTHEEGNWSLDVDPATTARVLRENAALFEGMR